MRIMFFAGTVFFTILCLTFWLLGTLSLDISTISQIGVTVVISNVSMISTESQLNSNQMYIMSRYTVVNNVLLQLLFDSSEMKERNLIITNDLLTKKEFQYTKYRNNFSSKNILLRDQLEISTITKSEKIWLKKMDLQNQKKKMEEFHNETMTFSSPKILIDKKSQVEIIFCCKNDR